MTTASLASTRLSAECPHCQSHLIVPEWSECVDAGHTTHVWWCPMCGTTFETTDMRAEPSLSDEELAKEFLPELLVA